MPASPVDLILGVVTGIAMGVLLQKGRAAKHDVVVRQFLLRDWTIVKIGATAVAVGAVGVWGMVQLGIATISPEPAHWVGVLVGAVLFGVGVAILGYGPATAMVAAGEGKKDARAGLGGMLAGAFLFVLLHDVIAPAQHALAELGPVTWPSLTRSPPWPWVLIVVAIALGLYAATRKRLRAAGGRS